MNKLVSGSYTLELQLNGRMRVFLPEILDLRNKRIKHIDYVDTMLLAPSGREIIDEINPQISIVEQNTKNEKISSLDLSYLAISETKGNRIFINKIIDFTSSYLDFSAEDAASANGKSMLLVFWYDEPSAMNYISEKMCRTTINTFEVAINSSSNKKFMFPENEELVGKKFQNIMLMNLNSSGTGKTPRGNAFISQLAAGTGYLTLQRRNYEIIRQLPLVLLNQVGDLFPIRLQNIEFDMTNSFVEFASTTYLEVGDAVCFNCLLDDE